METQKPKPNMKTNSIPRTPSERWNAWMKMELAGKEPNPKDQEKIYKSVSTVSDDSINGKSQDKKRKHKFTLFVTIAALIGIIIDIFVSDFVPWQGDLILLGIAFLSFGIAIDTNKKDSIQEIYERANNPMNKQIVWC